MSIKRDWAGANQKTSDYDGVSTVSGQTVSDPFNRENF